MSNNEKTVPAQTRREDLPRRFAVYNRGIDHARQCVVSDPSTKLPGRPDAPQLPTGWLEPVLLDKSAAQVLAAALDAEGTDEQPWRLLEAPLPCPCCGRELLVDDMDFLYPQNRQRTLWRAGCNEHDFGCGHEVFGATSEAVFAKWQAGAPHEGDAEDFGLARRHCRVRIGQPAPLPLPLSLDAGGTEVTVSLVECNEEGGTVLSLVGEFRAQRALMRRGLRALREAVGKTWEDLSVELVDYGGRVSGAA